MVDMDVRNLTSETSESKNTIIREVLNSRKGKFVVVHWKNMICKEKILSGYFKEFWEQKDQHNPMVIIDYKSKLTSVPLQSILTVVTEGGY